MIKVRYIATTPNEDQFILPGQLPCLPVDVGGTGWLEIGGEQFSVAECVMRNNDPVVDVYIHPIEDDGEISAVMLTRMRALGWTLREPV